MEGLDGHNYSQSLNISEEGNRRSNLTPSSQRDEAQTIAIS